MQITSVIGSFGLSFLIMWFGSVLVHVAARGADWKKILAVYAAIMIAVFVYGGVRMTAAPVDYSETVKVASIVSPFYRLFSDGEYETIPYEDSKAGTAIDLALGAFGIVMVLACIVLAHRKRNV